MSNYKRLFVFVTLFLLTLLQRAKAVNLKCFKCTTLVNNACWDPFNVSQVVLAEDCPDYNYACLKQHIPESYYMIPEELKRGCVPENYCLNEEHRSLHCSVCSSFLCNLSSSIAPSLMSMLSFISVNVYLLI